MKSVGRTLLFLAFLSVQGSIGAELDIDDIKLPRGFEIEVYANVPNARSLTLGYNNVVFVSNRQQQSVYAVVPSGGANPRVVEVAQGLTVPNGIAFHNGDLYVAEISRVLVFRNIMATMTESPRPDVLDIELPREGHHGWRYIAFGPDGKLYIGIGAPCNICDRDDEGFAQIWRMNPDGSGKEIFARGVRNTVGFTWHPDTGEMWFTDNGRDMLGDDLPPDELNRAGRPGLHFGYPYCHGGDLPDPEFGRDCGSYMPPELKLGPHVAALGLQFYTGDMFPAEYRGQLFIAEHGSWNRSKKIGYRVMLVELEDGLPVSYEPFAEGWLRRGEVSGRPVDLVELSDGSLLVSDDHGGRVFRIYYEDD
ncbi:MAG: sorbosone dehydrogenase family protein [Woeseiaceae bacterium]|nr:sorbosone dehydrogenase family protein [Woeseiaceae bacterium]NIP20106.1 sorbosone dehydrogenase family protein [Woeseiaceae bacterium]NIS88902.1 sorbosone dehydrogenase family protein [Woeseiaceae bacterium]